MSLFVAVLSTVSFAFHCKDNVCDEVVNAVPCEYDGCGTHHVAPVASSIPYGTRSNVISDPIRSCSEGFYYDEEVDCCSRDLLVDGMFSCAHVGGILEGDVCKCFSGQQVSCPSGYRFDVKTNTCSSSEMTPMIPSCAGVPDSELTADGRKCIFEVEVEPRLRCPDGSRLVGDVCIGHRDLPSEYTTYTCPSGWHRVGTDMCERLEEVSCDHVAVKAPACSVECPTMVEFEPCRNPCKVSKRIKHHHGRKLCHDDDCEEEGFPADAVCEVAFCQMHIGLPDLPYIEDEFESSCTRTTHMAAKPTCTVGELHGHRCVEELISTPMIECPRGCKSIDGVCLKGKSVHSEYVCPMGFEVQCKRPGAAVHPSKCECVAIESIEPDYECLDGGEFLPSGECLHIKPAELYCSDRDFSLVNGACIGKEHEPVRLEYIVSYVTEKPCEFEECVRDRVPVVSRSVRNKHVSIGMNGRTSTRCDVETCVNSHGEVLAPGVRYARYPEAVLLEEAEDYDFDTEDSSIFEAEVEVEDELETTIFGKESL